MEFNVVQAGKQAPWRRWLRRIGRFFLWIFVSVLVFFGVALSLAYIFEDEIKKYAIDSINEQLNTELRVREIELSLFRQFPYASLEFKDVSCTEAHPRRPRQNLFEARSLFLQFNIWNLFQKNYTVRRVTLKDARLNLYRDKEGQDNWHFWKESKDSTGKKSFAFNLSSVKLLNVTASYIDEEASREIAGHIDDLLLSGRFSDKKFALSVRSKQTVNTLVINGVEYAHSYKIEIDGSLDADTKDHVYKIKWLGLSIEDLPFECSGGIMKTGKGWFTDLNLGGKDLNISSILSMLPENVRNIKENYKSTGEIMINAHAQGYFNKEELPVLTADFSVKGATFRYVPNNIEMFDVYTSGSIRLGRADDSFVRIARFRGRQKNSAIEGDFLWKNFSRPEVQTHFKASLDLAEFLPFLPIDTLENVTGRADVNMTLGVKAGGRRFVADDFKAAVIDGRMELKQVNMAVRRSPYALHELSGVLVFDNNNVWVQHVNGVFSGNELYLDGKALNLLAYLLTDTEPLYLSVNLKSPFINLDRFLQENATAAREKTDAGRNPFALPERLAMDFKADVGKLVFRKFEATQIKGSFSLKNRVCAAQDVLLSTMDGEVLLNGVADNSRGGSWRITSNGRFTGVNISKLFYVFNNFEQDQLSSENISGRTDATFEFRATFDEYLRVDIPSIYALISITVREGELVKFTPLEKLAGWAKLEELQHVKFSTLKNEILIRDQKVIMPEMSIRSNALNLNLGGEHSFENNVDYRFNLDLGTLLANKFRLRRNSRQDEFGDIIDDGNRMRIYVRMHGPLNSPTFGLDGKGIKQKIEEDFRNERVNIRDIVREEMGRVKNDSILQKDPWLKQRQERRDSIRTNAVGGGDFEFE
ncbi:MAG: AsmA family protein [Flavobacteriales bacterium]